MAHICLAVCLGGVVAYEAAQQLTAAGQEVRMIALFDTSTPGYPKVLPSRGRYRREFGQWVRNGGIVPIELIRHLRTLARLVGYRTQAAKDRQLTSMGMAPIADDTDWSARLARMYIPKPIAVPVLQFLAYGGAHYTGS